MRISRIGLITAVCLCLLVGVPSTDLSPRSAHAAEVFPAQTVPGVELLVPEVISVRPHDELAFTQGLLLADGVFFESTGRTSSVREVDPETGEVIRERAVPDYFAEGLALVGDRLIQLTWRDGIALIYDRDTFEYEGAFYYNVEGWGLCYDGESLYHSDGSQYLYRRDPETFEILDRIAVTYGGQPVIRLNELECVGDYVYANVWQTDYILRIAKATGVVDGLIDASDLLTPEQRPTDSNGVLNGIAYDPENDVFYITGKLWSLLFEVRFVPFEG